MLPRQPNQSIIDGFRCLQYVVSQEQPTGVTQLATGLGLEQTRVHRLLRTLTHLGLIIQTEGRKYGPGPAIPILAAQTLHATRFSELALPGLEKLRRTTRKTVALGVLWERSVSYLYHGRGRDSWQKAIGGHELWPASNSGLGIAILAQLDNAQVREKYAGHQVAGLGDIRSLLAILKQTRAQGYAFVHTIRSEWTLAVALENNPYLAVGITGQLKESHVKDLLPKIQAVAKGIDLGYSLFRVR